MKNKSILHYTDTLAIFALLCVFATSVILVIMSGAKVYKSVSERDRQAYELRTTSMYLTTKFRTAESIDAIEVVDIDGINAIKITDRSENSSLCTYVYFHDGYLKESYTAGDASFNPNAGQKLVQAFSADFALDGRLVKATVEMIEDSPMEVDVYINGEGA